MLLVCGVRCRDMCVLGWDRLMTLCIYKVVEVTTIYNIAHAGDEWIAFGYLLDLDRSIINEWISMVCVIVVLCCVVNCGLLMQPRVI